MLAQQRFELSAMLSAGIAMRAVHPATVPGQPTPRVGVEVLAVAEVEQLALQRGLGLGVRPGAADLAAKYD